MLEAAYQGLLGILVLKAFALMVLGVLVGSFFAGLPGIGGLIGIILILPYSFTLSPYEAVALLLGVGAVSNTASVFSSVLISVPGSVGSQATILDGYPMAKRGEALRAFGAAHISSALGGLFGAVAILVSLPVLQRLVLILGSPEFFALTLWGLTMVGVLSGGAPLKGITAGILGVLMALVGNDPKSGIERFMFGQPYLWTGINIAILGVGLFAIPEMLTLTSRRGTIAIEARLGSGLWRGCKDALQHWWLNLRCSTIGVWVGILPGLGSTVADWFAYAHAVQTEKNPGAFGKGDVRGVIAPESANNAKEGGALIPTIAFGIPGSTSLAIMLFAFITVGIQPGPRMLTDQLPFTFAMIWTLVIASILASGLCLLLSKPFAKLCYTPFYVITPVTVVFAFMSAFAVHYAWGDLITLVAVGCLGHFMKLYGWPRPPVILGAVLGHQMETYLFISTSRYGWDWLMHPGVVIIFALILITGVLLPLRQRRLAVSQEVSEF